jgi:predicted membrane-bound mannosyltransferase
VGRELPNGRTALSRFLSAYTLTLMLVYSALPYKTPWCALGFYHGLLLLAAVGGSALLRRARGWFLKAAAASLLVAAAVHLGHQSWYANFVAYEDPRNPYVYAHTTSDVRSLVERVKQVAACHPDGLGMHVQVICPEDDYWPLPWYLREFRQVGWYREIPTGKPAPLIITQPQLEGAVARYVSLLQPPGQRHLYVPLGAPYGQAEHLLRPHVPVVTFIRRDLWELWQAAG